MHATPPSCNATGPGPYVLSFVPTVLLRSRHAPAATTGDSNTYMSLVLVAIMSHIVLLASLASCVSVIIIVRESCFRGESSSFAIYLSEIETQSFPAVFVVCGDSMHVHDSGLLE